MTKYILLTALLLCGFSTFANSPTDSLYRIWHDSAQQDSFRLKAIGQLCDQLVRNYSDSTLILSHQMLSFAKEAGLKKYQAQALFFQGRAYSYKSELSKTAEAYQLSLNLYNDIADSFGLAQVLNYIAGLHFYQGEYLQAIKTGEEAQRIARNINNQYLISGGTKVLGYAYKKLGNQVKALEIYESGLKLAEQVGDQLTMAYNLHAIADIYVEQGQQDQGAEYHKRSLMIYEDLNDVLGITDILEHTATLNLQRGNYSAALTDYQRNIKYLEASGLRLAIADNLFGIANVYIAQGNYENAEQVLSETEERIEDSDIPTHRLYLLMTRGKIGRLKNEFRMSITYCEQGLKIAEETGEIQFQRDACECLYDAYKKLQEGNKALVYHERYTLLSDSLNTTETVKKLQQMEFAQQMLSDSLEQVAELYKTELAHQKQMATEVSKKRGFMYGGLMILLLAGAQWSRLRYIRKSKTALQTEKDRSDELLLNILPADVADELKVNGKVAARNFDTVSILFTDFIAFTETAGQLSAGELVDELNYCFEGFDAIMDFYGIEKIKTIGDAYMAAGGLALASDLSIRNTVMAALELQKFIGQRKQEQDAANKFSFQMRVGIHTGAVIAGIVGSRKFQYDLWGDTVNTAARMESYGEPGRVNISGQTYEHIKEDSSFSIYERKQVHVKGKGGMNMYYVSLRSE